MSYIRAMGKDIKNQDIKTDLLVRIFGMRRSGNHAIIYWMLEHEKSNFFFNDSNVPFDAQCMLRRLRYPFPFDHKMTIISWENKPLDKSLYVKNLKCQREKTVLIMRDPFNWLASYLKKRWGMNDQLLSQYMMYLDEFTGVTNYFKDKVCINYNRWFLERDYREKIVKKLGFEELNDRAINYVPEEGGGSSFDSFKYQRVGRKMQVLNRWKSFMENARFHSFLKWPGLMKKSKTVWPEVYQEFCEHLASQKKFFI